MNEVQNGDFVSESYSIVRTL